MYSDERFVCTSHYTLSMNWIANCQEILSPGTGSLFKLCVTPMKTVFIGIPHAPWICTLPIGLHLQTQISLYTAEHFSYGGSSG